MKKVNRLAAACLVVAGGLAFAEPTNEVQTLSGFRVPTYDEQGVMTSQMFGDFAKVLPDGMVEITALRMEFYENQAAAEQKAQMVVTSPMCFYNRGKGQAFSDASVRIARENMIVTGTGFKWNSEDERLKILKNAKVVLKGVERAMTKEKQP
jgi:hypothetical protein